MSFKIKQNGIVKDLKLPAASIEVLDMEDNYTTNNLEEVLQELGESDGVYISNDEPDKDGIWISNEHTTQSGENKTFSALKDYIEENITPQVNKNEKRIDQLSNPNLLINGDFQIWQRGTNISCIPGIQYTADRWAMWTTENPTLSTSGWNLNWIGGGNDNLIQVTELPIRMIGTRMTLSFLIFAEEGVEITYAVDNGTTVNGADVTQYIKAVYQGRGIWETITLQVPSTVPTTSKLRVRFSCGASGKNKTIGLTNVKLEVGSIATPFIARSYGEELALCQRYYEVTDADTQFFGSRTAGDIYTFTYRYPVQKRVGATIKFSHGGVDNVLHIFSDGTACQLPCVLHKSIEKEVKWVMNASTGNFFFGQGASAFGRIIADAEIY